MKTGVKIGHDIVEGLLSSTDAGEKQCNDFLLTDSKPQEKTGQISSRRLQISKLRLAWRNQRRSQRL